MTSTQPNHFAPQAFIHPGARVHSSAIIDPFATIYGNVEIGAGTHIGPNVVIYDGVTIGENCHIMPNTTLSANIGQLEFFRESGPEEQMGRVLIGNGVHIEPCANIHGGIVIGDNCWIGSNCTIHDGARISRNCKIFPGAVISAIPQDLKFNGERTLLEIGENTTIREFATLNRGTEYHGKTVIGSNCLIMAYVHVAHDCIIGNHVVLVNSVNMAGHVEVDDYAIIGGMSGIHQFVKIGKHVMISGASVVRKDVPPYVKAGRDPVQYGGVNSIGLRRRGFSNETINRIQDIYRHIFGAGMNTGQALDYVEAEMPACEERDEVLTFIRKATRGIIKGY